MFVLSSAESTDVCQKKCQKRSTSDGHKVTTSSRPVKRLCGVRIVVYRFFVLMSTFLFRRIDEGEGQRSEEGEVSAASHRDLFSDLLLNVLHTADTSRPDLVGAQETNILGTKAKSASQAMRKGILKSSGDGDADDVFFDALFGSLLPSGTTVSLVVSDWRARYGAEPAAALAELYTLIARVRSSCEVDTPRQGFFPLILFVKRAAKHTVSLTHSCHPSSFPGWGVHDHNYSRRIG